MAGGSLPAMQLAVLDLHDTDEGNARLAEQLDSALKETGFFFLKNHGVPKELIDDMFRLAALFHAAPPEKKQLLESDANKVEYPFSIDCCGSSSSEDEKTFDEQCGNAMAYQINFPDVASRGNRWPDESLELRGFKDTVYRYVKEVDALARRLLPILAKALDVPSDFFDDVFGEAEMSQGMTIYPDRPRPKMGFGAHRDDGFFTLIAQSDKHGLQLCLEEGKWRQPQLMPGTFLINSGDVLSQWTNNRWPSTLHRVVNIPGQTRYAVPLFWGPKRGFVMKPIVDAQLSGKIGGSKRERTNDTFGEVARDDPFCRARPKKQPKN